MTYTTEEVLRVIQNINHDELKELSRIRSKRQNKLIEPKLVGRKRIYSAIDVLKISMIQEAKSFASSYEAKLLICKAIDENKWFIDSGHFSIELNLKAMQDRINRRLAHEGR